MSAAYEASVESSNASTWSQYNTDQADYESDLSSYNTIQSEFSSALENLKNMPTQEAYMYIMLVIMMMPLDAQNAQVAVLGDEINVASDYENITSNLEDMWSSFLSNGMDTANDTGIASVNEWIINIDLLNSYVQSDPTINSSVSSTVTSAISSLESVFGGNWPNSSSSDSFEEQVEKLMTYFNQNIYPYANQGSGNGAPSNNSAISTVNNAFQTINQSFSGVSTSLNAQLSYASQMNEQYMGSLEDQYNSYTTQENQIISNLLVN
jgi:hypothetical protein